MCLNNSFHYVSHDVFIQVRPVNVQCKFENRKGLSSTFSITNSKTPTHTLTLFFALCSGKILCSTIIKLNIISYIESSHLYSQKEIGQVLVKSYLEHSC